MYKLLIRPAMFQIPAEHAHWWTVSCAGMVGGLPFVPRIVARCTRHEDAILSSNVGGLQFANPIGLAAGWDKSGQALPLLDSLGFGLVEIGSVSAQPSLGNPQPRLFRLPRDRAIIVNYGLPNDGAERVAARLRSFRSRVPLGVNVVTTNHGPGAAPCSVDEILMDYERTVSLVHNHVDYLMLNLSCPNAEGGKDLFSVAGNIELLLQRLAALQVTCPVFLKLPPSEEEADHERWLSEAEPFSFVRGFSLNLPAGKPSTLKLISPGKDWKAKPGAVSGKPVEEVMNRCLAKLFQRMDRERFSLIASGGVFTAEDAYRKIRLGASLVQIYTALIYEGPGVVRRINRGLAKLLRRDGFTRLQDAVGVGE